jgi:hypothetical protein
MLAADINRALQQATLDLDEEFATRWVTTMREIVAQELDHETFIITKLTALKQWTRDRKREQHNLGYKFNPSRRKPHLVERDVNRRIEALRRKLEEGSERLRELAAATDEPVADVSTTTAALIPLDPNDEAQGFREVREDRAQLAREAREEARRQQRKAALDASATPVRSLEAIDQHFLRMVASDLRVTVDELANVSNSTVIDYYTRVRRLSIENVQRLYVDVLAGKPHPHATF